MTPERNKKAIRLIIRHQWQLMKDNWKVTLPAMLLPGIGNIFVFYVPPLVTAKLLAELTKNSQLSFTAIFPYLLAFAGFWLIGEALWRAGMYFLFKSISKGIRQLYANAMNYMLAKDMGFFNDNFAGALTKKATGYVQGYEQIMDTLSYSVMGEIIPLFFVGYVLWSFSPMLMLVLVSMLAFTISLMVPLIRRRQRLVAAREDASNVVVGYLADTFTNMSAVHGFAREKHEMLSHSRYVHDYATKAHRSWDYWNLRINMMVSPLYVLTNVLGLIIALWLGRHGSLSIEVIFVTFSYYGLFTRNLWQFNMIYRVLESRVTEAAQFTELLLDDPVVNDPLSPEKFNVRRGQIELKDVRFRYRDSSGEHLFNNLNLSIKSGEKVGLVGYSGGGKTTITKLLLRFMDVDSGEILIDGQNITHIKQTDLREAIAYVPQEPLLFHRSLSENIRYGRLDATDGEVREAAAMANATEFIERLAKGYETLVGERGVKLSGGQRQRIAIARAMIKNAPILILDEATSSLDSSSEKLIQAALWKLMQGRTALVIAHRLSTIQKMDRIIVLDQGQIIEEGTHKELLEKDAKYAELWAHQSGGFLEN